MPIYSDTYLDIWGNVFVNNNLSAYGITFEDFLRCPETYMGSHRFNLLSELEALQADLDALFEQRGHVVEMHGDQMIEPMQHKAPTKKWKTNVREDSHEQHHRTFA